MASDLELFRTKFAVAELTISENDDWIWSLRPGQCTLGAGILSLKRGASRLSELDPNEGRSLVGIVKVVEDTLSRAFAPDKMNYLMLMMVDAHLHYHIVPRYGRGVEFEGTAWIDKGWPALPDLSASSPAADALPRILEKLRDCRVTGSG